MKNLPNGLALSFALALSPAMAADENIPANICLVTPQGVATIYYQFEEEGVYAPLMQSKTPLAEKGWTSRFYTSNVSIGSTGDFASPAKEFNLKKRSWVPGKEGQMDVKITGWNGQQPQGSCNAKGSFEMGARIVASKDYPTLVEGADFVRHTSASAAEVSGLIASLKHN